MNDLMNPSSGGLALPSFVKQRESSLAKSMGGGLSSSVPSISLRNSRFHFRKDGNEIGTADTMHLDVILVEASDFIHRAYYDKAYDQDSDAKPACTSHRGDKPDGGENKQHGQNKARDNSGHEELANGLLGHNAINDEDDAWRDKDP